MPSSNVFDLSAVNAATADPAGGRFLAQRVGGPRTAVRYGRWTLELRGDEIADVAYDGVLLLRAIRPVVRDQDWNTVPVRVAAPASMDGPEIKVELHFNDGEISYVASLTVRLTGEEVIIDFHGRAESAFRRNRIGLVILHPAADAGRTVTVRHTDGRSTQGHWPGWISPHQPFTDIAGLAWSRDQVDAELTFRGDIFESEDQRNWTDASFKTYSTPLAQPFPVAVSVGDSVQQQARLRVADRAATPRARIHPHDVVLVGPAVLGRLPALSIGASLNAPVPALNALGAGFDCIVVELTGPEDRWPSLLGAAAHQAAALNAGLDVRLVTVDPQVVSRGAGLMHGLPVKRLAVFDPVSHLTSPPLWAALRQAAQQVGFNGDLVGGTRAHFTELNRGQSELPDDLPTLTFSLTPTMHATELPHMLDSLGTQRTVAENAVRIAGGRPVHVGPITLARRFNAVATSSSFDPATEESRATDPLQHTDFAAAWTLASVRALSVPGVAGLTYFEYGGDRGLLTADGLSPAGRVLAFLATAAGRSVLDIEAPDGLAALGLASSGHGDELLLANLTGRDREVLVHRGDETWSVPLVGWGVAGTRLG